MDTTITRLLASLFNIPDWAPRRLRDAAALTLAATALLAPTYFQAAITTWAHEHSQIVMERMQPLLDSITPDIDERAPTPDRKSNRNARDRHGDH